MAFALIKTDGLDEESRTRVSREAQAMARLGDHPHIVAIYDLGEEPLSSGGTQPFMVQPVLTRTASMGIATAWAARASS